MILFLKSSFNSPQSRLGLILIDKFNFKNYKLQLYIYVCFILISIVLIKCHKIGSAIRMICVFNIHYRYMHYFNFYCFFGIKCHNIGSAINNQLWTIFRITHSCSTVNSDLFSDRIPKLTLIDKLLKSKFEEFNFHLIRQQQSSSAEDVNVM